MKKTLFYLLTISLLATNSAEAQQDIHFSQFWTSPLNINPALVGMFDGDMRLANNYRSQWSSVTANPYTTMAASADFPVLRNYKNDNFMGVGVGFVRDQAGDTRFTSSQYSIAFSYIAQLNREQYLSFGLQTGLMQRAISGANISWGNQWDGAYFDPTLPSGENFAAESVSLIDFNFGMNWFYEANDYSKVFAGASVHHLGAPLVSFQSAEEKLLRKLILHGGAELMVENTNIVFMPNFMVKRQGPNAVYDLGSDVKYVLQEKSQITNFNDETSIAFGAYYRALDAVYLLTAFNWKGLTVGFSYDLNTSGLTVASDGLGGMEAMIMYRTCFRSGRGFNTPFL